MDKKEKIIRIIRIVMITVAVLCTVFIPPWDLVPPILTPLPDTVQEQVDKSLDYGFDGIIVYVDQAGEEPEFYAAGWKDKVNQIPADSHAFFKIASIHKLYIATAITKLDYDGRLSLDDTLADYFPELAGKIEYADEITVRMMVQHRSGLPNFTDMAGWDWFTPFPEDKDPLELIFNVPADFEPDSKYSYSNTNYMLLERIIDQAVGYSFREYITEDILAPIGITNTYFSMDAVDFDDVVSGYWYEYDDDLRYLEGSMVATAEDVGKFVRALNDGTLLNEEEQAIYSSIYEYGHTGWVPGYFSIAYYHEEIDTVVVQFVNTTGGETWGLANVVGGKTTVISLTIYNRIVRILENV